MSKKRRLALLKGFVEALIIITILTPLLNHLKSIENEIKNTNKTLLELKEIEQEKLQIKKDEVLIRNFNNYITSNLLKKIEFDTEQKQITKFEMSEYERDYVERVVMAECGNQEYRGMLAVVQTIADRAEILGISPYEVVITPKQYAKAWSYASDEIKKAVEEVLDNGLRIWNFKVTSFHSGNYPTSWGELLFVETIQDHNFYTWHKE